MFAESGCAVVIAEFSNGYQRTIVYIGEKLRLSGVDREVRKINQGCVR